MAMTIQQLHEAAKAFRTQFRPFIEVLDEVAELDNLANTRRELEASIASLSEKMLAETSKLDKVKKDITDAVDEAVNIRRQAEAELGRARDTIAAEEAKAREDAKRDKQKLKDFMQGQVDKLNASIAEKQAKLVELEAEVAPLEEKIDALRKAIANIVGGA